MKKNKEVLLTCKGCNRNVKVVYSCAAYNSLCSRCVLAKEQLFIKGCC